MFSVIDGIYIIADDIIIAAATVQEPNAILRRVLERVSERMHVRFNWEKLQLCVNTVKYLGTIISEEGIKPISNMPITTDKAGV